MNGWERVDYIEPTPDFHPSLNFHFDETFDLVVAEVKNVQENVGLCEVNGFNRFEITGDDRQHPRVRSRPTARMVRIRCGSSLMRDGKVVGTITSGEWGHRIGMNLADAFVLPELVEIGATMQLDLLGDMVGATVIEASPYDPSYALMRS